METFGGGYYFIDTYSTQGTAASNRNANIKRAAERAAAHMRQHGIKVLHVMARSFSDQRGLDMLQAFVDANDQLEGITGVEYSPYTGGQGRIYWFTNKAGYDIPAPAGRDDFRPQEIQEVVPLMIIDDEPGVPSIPKVEQNNSSIASVAVLTCNGFSISITNDINTRLLSQIFEYVGGRSC